MSHTVSIEAVMTDHSCVQTAAKSLSWQVLPVQEHKLFDSRETGLGIQIPGWKFPVVVQQDGALKFDDYGGRWGNLADIDKLKQGYTVAVLTKAAQRQGHRVTQRRVGETIKLEVSC